MELESIGVEYMKKKCKLTISILASNRKDTLPKCLESIKPLLEQVDSELIITDTGCDEELLETISKYTNNIITFEWCKDFAAARNVGLSNACGEWFMFIDDDEWFEDVDELIDFFNSGEEKEYESANYVVRNYYTKDGVEYSEWVVGRIFRIYENTKFIGRVHEYVEKNGGKLKQLVSYVHHYGYAFETEEKRIEHSKRNISLLEKEIEADPGDARNYAHIYQEYRANDDPEMIIMYAKKAMENADINYKGNRNIICSTYVALLWAYMRQKKYDEVIYNGEKFIENVQEGSLACAAIYFYLVDAYLLCGKYDKCIICAKKYIEIYRALRRNKERFYTEMAPMLNDAYKDYIMYGVYISGIEVAIKKDSMEDFCYFLKAYDWTKGWDNSKVEYFAKFVDMTIKHQMNEDIVYIYGMIFTDVLCGKAVMNRLQQIREIDSNGYAKVCDILAKIAGQPGYRSLVQIITICKNNNINLLKDMYKKAYIEDDNILLVADEFYEIAMSNKISLDKIIYEISSERWCKLLDIWLSNAYNRDIVRIKNYMDLLLKKDSEHMKILEQRLVEELDHRKK